MGFEGDITLKYFFWTQDHVRLHGSVSTPAWLCWGLLVIIYTDRSGMPGVTPGDNSALTPDYAPPLGAPRTSLGGSTAQPATVHRSFHHTTNGHQAYASLACPLALPVHVYIFFSSFFSSFHHLQLNSHSEILCLWAGVYEFSFWQKQRQKFCVYMGNWCNINM